MNIWLFCITLTAFPLYLILLITICRHLYSSLLKQFLEEIIMECLTKHLYYREFDISRIIEKGTKNGITSAYYENVRNR